MIYGEASDNQYDDERTASAVSAEGADSSMEHDMAADDSDAFEAEQPDEETPEQAAERRARYNRGAVEALLFVSDEPVTTARLSLILDISLGELDEILVSLAAEYEDDDRGIQLREVAGGWRLYSHPAYHDIIERYVLSWDTQKLSQAALEALAVIAYNQPTTRAVVSSIRGVNSDAVVSSLVEKGIVREAGRDTKSPGQPILYATTRTFLEKFGLKSMKDLPPLEDYAANEETKRLITERLSASSFADVLDDEQDVAEGYDDADLEDDVMTFEVGDEPFAAGGLDAAAGSAPEDAVPADTGAASSTASASADEPSE